jgi:hypothetical protein
MSGRAGTSKGVPLSRVFITGSSDGLGLMAGQLLLAARDVKVQDDLLDYCAELVGVELPR